MTGTKNDYLDFAMPEFVRRSWVGDRAREMWEPRMHRVTAAWLEIEWLSVVAGVRDCGSTLVNPVELIDRAWAWAEHGLAPMPLEIHGSVGKTHNGVSQPRVGDPFLYRLIVGTPENTVEFKKAWDAGDEGAMGRMLGYPECCTSFFGDSWSEGGSTDQTWDTALGTAEPDESGSIEVSGPPETNILWRWMGVRALPHLPCSFACEPSGRLAGQMIDVGRANGYDEEMDWMLEMLSWPVEWSSLHGIAEIKTPILKVTASTDPTRSKYTVRRPGSAYPEEGAIGLDFPFRVPGKVSTESRKYHRGIENPIRIMDELPEWYASDNGFQSLTAQQRAFDSVLKIVSATVPGEGGRVLHMGCGNGALLEQIGKAHPQVVPYGVCRKPEILDHCHSLLPEFRDNIYCEDFFEDAPAWDDGTRYDLVILMPGRLLEGGPWRTGKLQSRLESCCDNVLVYAYSDWLTKYQDLEGLASRAGLTLLSAAPGASASLARFRKLEQPAAPAAANEEGNKETALVANESQ